MLDYLIIGQNLTAFYIAVFAVVLRGVLMQYGNILFFYTLFLEKLPEYIAKPLGQCEKCFAGQLAFWYYIAKYFHKYNAINHIFFVSFSIFLTWYISLKMRNLESR
jgi:hypothetical protein